MVNIKNTSPAKSALMVEGEKVEYGKTVSVSKAVADYLLDTPNFSKASLGTSGNSATTNTKSKGATS